MHLQLGFWVALASPSTIFRIGFSKVMIYAVSLQPAVKKGKHATFRILCLALCFTPQMLSTVKLESEFQLSPPYSISTCCLCWAQEWHDLSSPVDVRFRIRGQILSTQFHQHNYSPKPQRGLVILQLQNRKATIVHRNGRIMIGNILLVQAWYPLNKDSTTGMLNY